MVLFITAFALLAFGLSFMNIPYAYKVKRVPLNEQLSFKIIILGLCFIIASFTVFITALSFVLQ